MLLLLLTVIWLHRWSAHRWVSHGSSSATASLMHARHAHSSSTWCTWSAWPTWALVLGCCSGDTHGTIATVYALHLAQGKLLIGLIGEAHKAISTRHAGKGVRHDLGGLAGWEAALEERYKDVFIDLGAKIANEDAVFGSTIIATTAYVSQRFLGASKPTYLRSAKPPPDAQLSLKGRLEFGI